MNVAQVSNYAEASASRAGSSSARCNQTLAEIVYFLELRASCSLSRDTRLHSNILVLNFFGLPHSRIHAAVLSAGCDRPIQQPERGACFAFEQFAGMFIVFPFCLAGPNNNGPSLI